MHLRVNFTGLRGGDIIIASPSGKQNAGCMLEVCGNYPVHRDIIDNIDSVYRDLAKIPRFHGMSPSEVVEELSRDTTSKDKLYLNETDLIVKFLRVGGPHFETLSKEDLETIGSGEPVKVSTVADMFPKKTLIFRPNNWCIWCPPDPSKYTGLTLNLDTLEVKYGPLDLDLKQYIFDVVSIDTTRVSSVGMYGKRHPRLTWERISIICEGYALQMNAIRKVISWFTPAVHKSLIQKIIRNRASTVSGYPASSVLLTTMALLLLGKSYVPNLHRTMYGLESAPKRIAVSIHEDSFTDTPHALTSMYASSLMSQRNPLWMPSLDHIKLWFSTALQSMSDPRMFKYDWFQESGMPDLPLKPVSYHKLNYFLIAGVKSFKSDVMMVRSIARNESTARKVHPSNENLEMPIEKCIDHHCRPDILWYMPPSIGNRGEEKFGYPEQISMVWNCVVGENPRKPSRELDDYEKKFSDDFRRAQRLYFAISRVGKKTVRQSGGETVTKTFEVKPEWLAALIGPMDIKYKRNSYIVVVNPSDLTTLTVIRKPTRVKKPPIDSETDALVKLLAMNKLDSGVQLKPPSYLSMLSGYTLVLDSSSNSESGLEYTLRSEDGSVKRWSEVREFKVTYPVYPKLQSEPVDPMRVKELASCTTGDGIEEGGDVTFETLLNSLSHDQVQRLAVYLRGVRGKVQLFKIDRDGTGLNYSVHPNDTTVHHVLMSICVTHPAALEYHRTHFKVKDGPLFWTLRKRVLDSLRKRVYEVEEKEEKSQWITPVPDDRQLAKHQLDSVKAMILKNKRGGRGHGIWITTGLGKTLILVRYIHHLITTGQMPKYCVYTVPSSAVDNIEKEFQLYRIPVQRMDMRKNSKAKKILPYTINIVFHDHLRRGDFPEQYREIANDTFFIVDEFHKTLSQSIRTSLCLEFSKLSWDFAGLSGTIVKDSKFTDLAQWLEQIVDFEVTNDNFWVALSSLISKKVTTSVEIREHLIELEIPDELLSEYKSLIPPALGGVSHEFKFSEAIELCYTVVNSKIIEIAKEHLSRGESVFIVARNKSHQESLASHFNPATTHLIDRHNPITLLPGEPTNITVVITTTMYSEGYTLSAMHVKISSVYPSNQFTRDQLDGRLNRINQRSPYIDDYTVVSGVLKRLYDGYQNDKSFADSVKDICEEVSPELLK